MVTLMKLNCVEETRVVYIVVDTRYLPWEIEEATNL